jgi:hypothetical protein
MFLTSLSYNNKYSASQCPPPPGYFILSPSLSGEIMSFFMHWAYTCLRNFRAVSIFCKPLIKVVPLNTRVLVFYVFLYLFFLLYPVLFSFLNRSTTMARLGLTWWDHTPDQQGFKHADISTQLITQLTLTYKMGNELERSSLFSNLSPLEGNWIWIRQFKRKLGKDNQRSSLNRRGRPFYPGMWYVTGTRWGSVADL